MSSCHFCQEPGGRVLHRDGFLRVVLIDDPLFPGYCRVILNAHAREMTDLAINERNRIMEAVFAVESSIRSVLAPEKINLASLGNQVPHLHWHIIPRFADDTRFPNPVWGEKMREADREKIAARQQRLSDLALAIGSAFGRIDTEPKSLAGAAPAQHVAVAKTI